MIGEQHATDNRGLLRLALRHLVKAFGRAVVPAMDSFIREPALQSPALFQGADGRPQRPFDGFGLARSMAGQVFFHPPSSFPLLLSEAPAR